MAATDSADRSPWHAAFSGCCATLIGIGIARFAYTPLIPALISADWYTHSQAAYLGAANLAGYLAGALLGRFKMQGNNPAPLIRAMMLLTALSMAACALQDLGYLWAAAWRIVSGYTGGVIIVTAAPAVIAATPPKRRGLVAGLIFAGIGIGVIASGTLVPFLIKTGGPIGAWLGLAALAAVLSLAAWTGWPKSMDMNGTGAKGRFGGAVMALFTEYGLAAFGLVPHMIFFVVFIAHGLSRGLQAGALCWIAFGIGATLLPPLSGRIADWIGFKRALRLGLVVEAAAVGLPVVATGMAALMISGFLVGGLLIGIVGLVLGRIHDFVDDSRMRARAWAFATTSFAVGQAAAGYAFTFLFDMTGSYELLFAAGAAMLAAALILDFAAGAMAGRAAPV